ncbi:GPW/gp25 family protein [Halomicronema sp. CCY15110]|uniref:GPW/gp25 family protein n=1 Tax=Halomicronema sp. CCY15110 TaxID=2767773 RepID=UPI00195173E0|nr:GPW/gp25 family protein [Halomicronema sp. CCY15110]
MANSIFSLQYPLAVDGGLGRLAIERDYEAHVEQMMRQVLLTSPGERVNRPDFGCGVRRLLFSPNSDVNATLAQVTIFQALERWLGTVLQVQEVRVTPQDERLDIEIVYVLKARQENRYLNVEVRI